MLICWNKLRGKSPDVSFSFLKIKQISADTAKRKPKILSKKKDGNDKKKKEKRHVDGTQ